MMLLLRLDRGGGSSCRSNVVNVILNRLIVKRRGGDWFANDRRAISLVQFGMLGITQRLAQWVAEALHRGALGRWDRDLGRGYCCTCHCAVVIV